MPITPKLPLSFDEFELYESTEDLTEITRFHIKNIVLTNPGEKISDPEFGVGIKRYLFENFTSGTIANINFRMRSQISRYASHVEVLSVQIDPFEDENSMSIKLSYYIPIINKSDILSFSISNSTAIY
tara:strand:- start:1998 stop:2381 length:384 start_codon:yes stop_codon:yes gene_type:complete